MSGNHRFRRGGRRSFRLTPGVVLASVIIPITAFAGASATRGTLVARQEPDTSMITPAMVDAGRVIFHGKGMCFACHGAQLQGTQVAPTLKNHAWRDAKNGEFANIYFVASHGVPGTLMVAFPGGINRTELLQVVSYVWSVGQGKAKP
jgi:mono/diheme cytochrome c family protein